MALNILRAEHSAQYPYVMMSKETANDHGLSLAARGLLAWLLDKPDSWEIDPEAIARLNKTSIYEVKKLLKELTTGGYLIPPQRQKIKGKFWYTPYTLLEKPGITDDMQLIPYGDFSVAQPVERNPLNGNSATEHVERSRTGVKHEIAAGQITKTNNYNKQEQEIPEKTTTTALPAKPEAVALETVGSGGGYVIPVLDSIDLWESKASTLPAEVEQAERDKVAFKAKAQEVKPAAQSKPVTGMVPPLPEPSESELKFGRVSEYFEQKTGDLVPPRISVLIQKAVDLHPEDWIKAAIDLAESKDKLFWEYVNGILFRWKLAGGMDSRAKSEAPALSRRVDDFDPFDREVEPDIEPAPEPAPIDKNWEALTLFVQSQDVELHRLYLKKCRFGGVHGGALIVFVPNESVQNGCRWEMNYREKFFNWAEVIWQGLTSVDFIIEGVDDYALPETP